MATYIRLYSDIHLDFDLPRNVKFESVDQVWIPPPLPEDADTILLLAGDLWYGNRAFAELPNGTSWIGEVAKRFKHVAVVLGNHDYWDLSLQSAPAKAKEACAKLPNVTLLEQDVLVVDGVKVVGGTLWTDYGRNEVAMNIARNLMKDFKYTTFGTTRSRRKLRPMDLFEVHRQTTKFIFNNCQADHPGQTVIVMTHMAPTEQSISNQFRDQHLENLSYYSNLQKSLETHCKDVKLWVHGHVHHVVRYLAAHGCWVITNPRGYKGEQTDYNPLHQLKISEL